MKIKITAFGIAKDIMKTREQDFELAHGDSIADLKEKLVERYADFQTLTSLSFAVNEEYCPDEHLIQPNDHVVIIPPVSGG